VDVRAFIHILTLPQLQDRLRVHRQWFWSYLTGQRSSRLMPEGATNAERLVGARRRPHLRAIRQSRMARAALQSWTIHQVEIAHFPF
jgi:hypothetical protein